MNQTVELLSLFEYENQVAVGKATSDCSGEISEEQVKELSARCACEHSGETAKSKKRNGVRSGGYRRLCPCDGLEITAEEHVRVETMG